VKQSLSYSVFVWGIVVGVLGLAILLSRDPTHAGRSLSGISSLLAVVLLGTVPLVSSLRALRNPKSAGLLLLGFASLVLPALFLATSDAVRYGGFPWQESFAYSAFATLVTFILPGLFWLLTSTAGWPRMVSPPRPSLKRRVFGAAITTILLSAAVTACVIAIVALAPPMPGDCFKGAPPLLKQRYPEQAVFIARVIRVGFHCDVFHGERKCQDALGVVQQRFWGLDSKVVLLTGGLFEDGETYLVDGMRHRGLLTRFLPIVTYTPCSRTSHLKNAGVDLRLLHDGPPRDGARIIGRTTRGWGDIVEPGTKVLITGPSGTITTFSDQQGIYDVHGLPPGHYDVRRADRPNDTTAPFASCQWSPEYQLKPGDAAECTLMLE